MEIPPSHPLSFSSRSCLCAGPYGHRLLGIPPAAAQLFEQELLQKKELLRPGFVRITMSYEWADSDVNFVLRALQFVAEHGHRLLKDYTFYPDTGEKVEVVWAGLRAIFTIFPFFGSQQASTATTRCASNRRSAAGCTTCHTLRAK